MGAAEARLFTQEGAKVLVGDILVREGTKLVETINKSGGTALFVKLDVTKENEWLEALNLARSQLGGLDVLVNNAGISGAEWGDNLTQEAWDSIMAVNATGVFLGTKVIVPELRRNGGGSIINISSQMGIVGSKATHPAYNASKGAVRSFTKAIAIRYAHDNIRCNSVHPGPIDTPMSYDIYSDLHRLKWVHSMVPLGRRGTPNEVASGVLYLASDESSFITGAELVIDGGWIAQ